MVARTPIPAVRSPHGAWRSGFPPRRGRRMESQVGTRDNQFGSANSIPGAVQPPVGCTPDGFASRRQEGVLALKADVDAEYFS